GVCAIFGILKARGVYVPADSTAPAQRIRSILDNCRVRAVFVEQRCADVATGIETVIVTGTLAAQTLPEGAIAWDKVLENAPRGADPASRSLDDIAYILYTSGSTGIPKGVTLSQRNALSFVEWCSSVFTPN